MTTNVIKILQLKLELERKQHKSKSEAQARLMQAVAHNPEFAEKVDIPQSVGQEFIDADKTAHDNDSEPQQANRPEPIHFELNGLPITIENQAGTIRKGIDSNGHEWAVQLKAHYGEIRGSTGADGDYVDCFINPEYMPDEQSIDDPVFIVNQNDPYTGEFDEVKVMIGWNDIDSAKAAYAENYEEGYPEQPIVETNYSDLTKWLNSQESTEEFEE